MLDWVEKFADRIGAVEDFNENAKKEYLDGVVEMIEVRLDEKTNDHQLKIIFKMRLVGDEHIWTDTSTNPWEYEVVEGDTDASMVIP